MQNLSNRKILTFKYALSGILTALKEEPNLKFHFLTGFSVIFISLIFNISRNEWLVIILLIGFVISVELTNTAIEAVVDEFTDKEHPGAKLAKDISAGAVLISAITSAAVGIIIFLPYLMQWII